MMRKLLFISVILLITIFTVYSLLIYFIPSCGYKKTFDKELNRCNVIIRSCTGVNCVSPVTAIQCGETTNICNKELSCNCSDKDNSEWYQNNWHKKLIEMTYEF